jgi:predicted CXXCH cytochrome family protein
MPQLAPQKRRARRVAIGLGLLVILASALGLGVMGWRLLASPLRPGLRAYERGDWDAAMKCAEKVLQTRPGDAMALRLLARSAVHLGRDELAVALYTRHLTNKSFEPEDFVLMGLVMRRRGQEDKALKIWGKALELKPLSPRLLDDLAQLFLHPTDFEGEDVTRIGVFEQQRASGQPLPPNPLDQAATAASMLRQYRGWESRADISLGMIRVALYDLPGAAEAFRRVVRDDPEVADKTQKPIELRKILAKTFLGVGRPDEARPHLEFLRKHAPDSETFWLLSRVAMQQGSKAEVLDALARAGSYRGDHPLEYEPSPFVGEARCAQCHRSIFEQSLAHRHTQTYYRGEQLGTLPTPEHPWPDPNGSQVTHTVRKAGSKLWEETRVGDQVIRSLVEYAFGTKDRYLTMVSKDEHGQYRIARMSYACNSDGCGWTRSLLDTMTATRTEAYPGQMISQRDGTVKCLQCHVTFARGGADRVGPETADRAIGCERCHGPGAHHIQAVEAGLTDLAIVNPATASPALATEQQCNGCHVLDTRYNIDDHDNPGWIRSQGVGWIWSRCNTESGGAFGCVSCHNPHQTAAAMTTEQYEAKCLGCHSTPSPSAPKPTSQTPPTAAAGSTVCPVNPVKGCLDCHMPRRRYDGSTGLALTDHYIRVRREPASKNGK